MNKHDFQDIVFTYRDGVGTITLNRPDKLNSFTTTMHQELAQVLTFVEAQSDCRGLIITGAGRGFCAGQDLQERKPLPPGQKYDLSEGLEQRYKPLILRLRALPVPVIAFVNGVAAGAGASLALVCDVIFAAESAKFIQAFTKIGLLPDAGSTHFLPRLVGTARAMGAALFAEAISAQQAAEWGLIWKCVPDSEFAATLDSVHQQLSHGPTAAYAATKQAIHASSEHTLEQQLNLERDLQKTLGYTDDYTEGVASFKEKRAPRFTGQ